MKKNLKVILIFSIIIIAWLLLSTKIFAAELENKDSLVKQEQEYKVMKYDRITNETTEVNMEEVRMAVEKAISENKINTQRDSTNSYSPYKFDERSEMMVNTVLSTNSEPTIDVDIVNSMVFNRKNCKITVTDDSGQRLTGSAVLVGEKLALTGAHCVFKKDGSFYRNWTIYPGYKNGSVQGGVTCGWSQVYYSTNYNPDPWIANDYADDWAICVLEEPLGSYNGYARSSKL